ncbi:MFS transporter [Variovorax ginsengisoli]|uniref:MFS transporter n=1 Tax=Variovorax ginsengisoli TaxID=363844 RepID=A0ABT8S5F5_9BURK|nr:MFS transporter [Variovorax ginsengisoli]MDN8614865.1 MFS transporter [Variovorax ginsengisoli]MDO1534035.1 MFS transporter [Variovorax ginsengisoli]
MPSAFPSFLSLSAVCLAALMFGLEISSVPVILPVLEAQLHADFQSLQWVMNAYTIACTTVLMATGTLADRYGRRRVFALTVLAFGVASLLCGLAPSAPVLIGARFLQGMAGGAMFICSIAILSHQFPEGKARARAFAIWGVVAGVGLGFGPAVGGFIVSLASWHWVFLVQAPLAALGLALIWVGVVESNDPQARQQKLDLAGIVTLTIAVLGLALLITQGDGLGWASGTALGLMAVTAASWVGFVLVERFRPHPMFDFSVFRIREFSGAIVGCIGMNCSYWPFMIYLPLYFSAGLGYDTTLTGLALLVYTVPFLVMPPVAQWLLLRYQARVVIPAGLSLIGLGFALMKLGSGLAHLGHWTVLPGALLAGIGLGLTTTPATNMTTASVPANRAGMASGMDVSARLITLAINIAVMGLVLVAGILSALRAALGTALDDARLRTLAERLAGGDVAGAKSALAPLMAPETVDSVLQVAVVHGFGWVMLYGAVAAWITALLSLAVFGRRRLPVLCAAPSS